MDMWRQPALGCAQRFTAGGGCATEDVFMALPQQNLLARIPSVEILLHEAQSQDWAAAVPRRTLVEAVRAAVDQTRDRLLESRPERCRRRDLAPDDPGRRPAARRSGRRPLLPQGRSTPRASSCTRPWAGPCCRPKPRPNRRRADRLLAAPGRPGQRPTLAARRADRRAAQTAHRRRGRHGRQQQRRRHRRSFSIRSPAARKSSYPAASSWKSAARSACPT